MLSGAGHDACYIARVAPTSMILMTGPECYGLTLHFQNNDFLHGFMGRMLRKPQ
jgi:hypothetical protein